MKKAQSQKSTYKSQSRIQHTANNTGKNTHIHHRDAPNGIGKAATKWPGNAGSKSKKRNDPAFVLRTAQGS